MNRYAILSVLLLMATLFPTFGADITLYTEEMPPYNYLDSTKVVTGFSTELIKEMADRAGITTEHSDIAIYPWARAFLTVQEKPNSCLYTMTRTEERDTLFKWVGPIAPRTIWFWKLKSRTDIVVTNEEDLKKYTIGAVREFSSARQMDAMGLNLDLCNLERHNFLKLVNDRFDMLTALELAAAYHMNAIGHSFDELEKVYVLDASHEYYYAFNLDTPDTLIEKLQNKLDEIKADGTYEKLRLEYLAPHAQLTHEK